MQDDTAAAPVSTEYLPDSEYEADSHSLKESATDKPKANLLAGLASTSNASHPAVKRQSETTLELNKKKKKKKKIKNAKLTSDEKLKHVAAVDSIVPSSQILLSEDDEIVVLQGLIEKNGNLIELCDFLKKSIKANISMKHLGNMVSSLKRKFQENEMKIGDGDDESLVFSKPHDQKMFELSKMIWGKTSTPNTAVVAVVNNEDDPEKSKDDTNNISPMSTLFKDYVNRHGLDLAWLEEKNKREHLAEKWNNFKIAEIKYLLVRAKFEAKMQEVKLVVFNK